MATYIICYLGGNPPANEEEVQQNMAAYHAWIAEIDDIVISPTKPLKYPHTLLPDGTVRQHSESGLSGFTLIDVDSVEQAIAVAKACPFLRIGGKLEVAELAVLQ